MCSCLLLIKRFAFDWNNPIGYLIAITIEYIILGYQGFTVACSLSLNIGEYLFAIAATEEFQRFAPIINDKAQSNDDRSSDLKAFLVEFINSHGIMKQLSTF